MIFFSALIVFKTAMPGRKIRPLYYTLRNNSVIFRLPILIIILFQSSDL